MLHWRDTLNDDLHCMQNTLIIGIAGASASGKTLLANTLIEQIDPELRDQVALIAEDSYYNNQDHLSMEQRLAVNYDSPESKEFDLLCDHLEQLQKGHSVEIPEYDFVNHTRSGQTTAQEPTRVILIEGILLFTHRRLRSLMATKIYVDTPLDICFIRRLKRDVAERGRTMESVIEQYENTVRPSFYRYIEPSKKHADLIVPSGGSNQVAINILSAHLKNLLKNP